MLYQYLLVPTYWNSTPEKPDNIKIFCSMTKSRLLRVQSPSECQLKLGIEHHRERTNGDAEQ